VRLADVPELDEVGGWARLTVGGRTINLAHVEDDCFVAMETACTHEGAVVEYRPDRQQFVCTLHGAVYVDDGTPILGPTEVPLVTYPAARDGDSVWVHIG
jgi:cytochrome b6-f complex iron-sulfur subunit